MAHTRRGARTLGVRDHRPVWEPRCRDIRASLVGGGGTAAAVVVVPSALGALPVAAAGVAQAVAPVAPAPAFLLAGNHTPSYGGGSGRPGWRWCPLALP